MKFMSLFLIVLASIILIHVEIVKSDEGPKIKIPLGELQGKYLKSRDGKTYSTFLGIPYAEPPKRFESPKPVKNWEGVKNATNSGNHCLQGGLGIQPSSQSGSEDCLYLNVFTPNVSASFPVMVYIHGGAFMLGSANMHGGEFYMDEDVVLVTLNYRLGALGFLSTGDDVIPGNFGLKDQNLALRWVQENIEFFGGNKDKVTISGTSAGAASVSYHILSPQSKGLFHAAISQSGSALNPWAFVMNPKDVASELSKKIGCPTNDSREMADCLKGKTVDEIMEGQNSLHKWHLDPLAPFAPSIEDPSTNDSFLTESPHTLLNEGRFNKIPWLVTSVKDEGLFSLSIIQNDKLRNELNEEWDKLAPLTFQYDNTGLSEENKNLISAEIKKFYFDGGQKIEKSSAQNLSDLYSDRWFVHGVQKAALLHAKHSPVYAGIFGFSGLPSALTFFGVQADENRVIHGDDVKFYHDWSALIWGADNRTKEAKDAQEKASKMLVKLWVQFASNPSSELKVNGVTWKNVSSDEIEARSLKWMLLDEKPTILSGMIDKRLKFWDDVLINKANNETMK